MKIKNIIVAVVIAMSCIMLTGCGEEHEIEQLRAEINTLTQQRDALNVEIEELSTYSLELKEDAGVAKYILTLEIRQEHITLDFSEMLKDDMNAITIQIPVDKEYFDSVEVGDTISNEFRIGSLIMKSSFGSWKIKVKDKIIQ